MVNGIKGALKSEKRRFRGFTPLELTDCLGRMAVNDSNKIKVPSSFVDDFTDQSIYI